MITHTDIPIFLIVIRAKGDNFDSKQRIRI